MTGAEASWTLETAKLWIMREVSYGRNKTAYWQKYLVDDLVKEQKLAWLDSSAVRLTHFGRVRLVEDALDIGWNTGDQNP